MVGPFFPMGHAKSQREKSRHRDNATLEPCRCFSHPLSELDSMVGRFFHMGCCCPHIASLSVLFEGRGKGGRKYGVFLSSYNSPTVTQQPAYSRTAAVQQPCNSPYFFRAECNVRESL